MFFPQIRSYIHLTELKHAKKICSSPLKGCSLQRHLQNVCAVTPVPLKAHTVLINLTLMYFPVALPHKNPGQLWALSAVADPTLPNSFISLFTAVLELIESGMLVLILLA